MAVKKNHQYTLFFICLSQFILACAPLSSEHYVREVHQQSLQRHSLMAGHFPLIYYTRPSDKEGDTLHIYIGGDGVPWQNKIFVTEDPGPYNPLVLQLMRQDSKPSIYLGRPCYQGQAKRPPCQPQYWTSARFSEAVIHSMKVAIEQLMTQYQYRKLVLIGYSGGGTLAVLLASRLPQTTTVVTIAGNLDTGAWTDYHHYSALSESLNPTTQRPLSSTIMQIHLQGRLDKNIPPGLTAAYIEQQANVKILTYDHADHSCCWQRYWPDVLSLLP